MNSPVKIWRNQKKIKSLLGITGKIVSWTLVRVPQEGFANQAPYPVVIVKLESGESITAQMVDWQEKQLKIGQKVTTIIRKIAEPSDEGVIPYGIKVKAI